jgi:two-component system sensor histidine kinase BaeS
MKQGLRTKLSLSYIFVALVCVAIITLLSNVLLVKQFNEYVIRNQTNKNNALVAQISQQYNKDKKWRSDVIESIGINALEGGMIVKVTDESGEVIWDATAYNNGYCQQMIEHMSRNMAEHIPDLKGGYISLEYPVKNNFEEVGTVQIGYYGPYYYNDNDLAFISTLNKLLFGAGLFSMLFALVTGAFMAKRLSMPISRVIKAAQMIARGYFADRIVETTNTREIVQLTTTINDLADTLQNQENLRKRLTADVAHELRTPLATLQGHLEAMIDGIWKPDAERLKSCHDEVIRINRMVGDLEKLAKFESENLTLDKSEFDITERIFSIIKSYEIEFINKNIEVEFKGEKQSVNADSDKISQVVVNLLSNALKYTPGGGKINISVRGSENMVELIMSDNGMGIPAEDLPYIFERFYRADKSRNRTTGGAGIGLTISKAIVDAHKGNINVKSEFNKGTEFTVSIPRSIE